MKFSATRWTSHTIFIIICIYILFLSTLPTDLVEQAEKRNNLVYKQKRVFPQSGNEATLENCPWKIEKLEKVYTSVASLESSYQKFIFSDFSYSNGLGNQMFQLAALLSIARKTSGKVILPENILLRRAFHIENERDIVFVDNYTTVALNEKLKDFKITVKDCCSYRTFPSLFAERRIEQIDGYFQNFKYFHPDAQKSVQKLFNFVEPVKERASEFLENVGISHSVRNAKLIDTNVANDDQAFEANEYMPEPKMIGVHVRHGMDISMNSRNRRHGHIEAPIAYYKRAIQQISKLHENAVFIICSDDVMWVRRNLKLGKEISHFFCPGHREVDMSILASCDPLILSTGTFSWWSAYLNLNSSPDIYYYKNWPSDGSPMQKMLNKSEYFLKEWVALE